jgi:chaperonin GroES
MARTLEPLGDRIVIVPIDREEKTKGGIIIPDTAKEKPQEGKVTAVGPGKMNDEGNRVPPDVKVGDIVLYPRYGGTEYKLDDVEYMILRESDLLAVISSKKSK